MDVGNITIEQMKALPEKEKLEVLRLLEQKVQYEERRQFYWMYPEALEIHNGNEYHPRHLYPKHMEFFKAGKDYAERCGMCANRVGKSFGMGGYETAAHLMGLYPDWWPGHKFHRPITAWAAGKNNPTTRDIIQNILFGKVQADGAKKSVSGTGLIPYDKIGRTTWQRGTADMIDTSRVQHFSDGHVDGNSTLTLKSYERGRGSFEGDAIDLIWLDEECPLEIYEECLYRTMTTGGRLMLTFTPLEGLTETVLQYLPDMNPDAEKIK